MELNVLKTMKSSVISRSMTPYTIYINAHTYTLEKNYHLLYIKKGYREAVVVVMSPSEVETKPSSLKI